MRRRISPGERRYLPALQRRGMLKREGAIYTTMPDGTVKVCEVYVNPWPDLKVKWLAVPPLER